MRKVYNLTEGKRQGWSYVGNYINKFRQALNTTRLDRYDMHCIMNHLGYGSKKGYDGAYPDWCFKEILGNKNRIDRARIYLRDVIYRDSSSNESVCEDMLTGLGGGGLDNTLSAASHMVQGNNIGYTYNILAFNDTLQQKVNDVDNSYYIHPGSTVRGVGVNNPDKHYTGIVTRIVKNANGEVEFLVIQAFKTSKQLTIRADENLELIIHHSQNQEGIKTITPSYDINIENKNLN